MGNLGKLSVATGFEWLPKVQKMPNLVTLMAALLTFEEVLLEEPLCLLEAVVIDRGRVTDVGPIQFVTCLLVNCFGILKIF